jgi:spore coat protein U-like protein
MFKKVALVAFVGAVSASTGAFAGTDTQNMAVSANISASCSVAPAPLAFGTALLPLTSTTTAVNSTSIASVTCSTASPYTLNINGGLTPGSYVGGATRAMKFGAILLPYEVYTDAAHLDPFAAAAGPSGTGTGTGTSTVTIYGQIPAQPTPTAGTYTDTLAVVINY